MIPEPEAQKGGQSPAQKPSDGAGGETGVLSPEEQMALYEESLKETDWGHQPC